MNLNPHMADICVDKWKGVDFNTGRYGEPPLKIKILKIAIRSDLRWPKLGLDPKFHDPGTFGGFGKCEQSFIRYPADI